MQKQFLLLLFVVPALVYYGLSVPVSPAPIKPSGLTVIACATPLPQPRQQNNTHNGMVWIPAGVFTMGNTNNEGRPDEYPQHKVQLTLPILFSICRSHFAVAVSKHGWS